MEESKDDGNISNSKDAASVSSDYLSDFQAGQYQNNKQFIDDEVVFCAGETEATEKVIFIFGKFFPITSNNSKKELAALRRYFIFTMDEIVNSKYYLFFFNSGITGYAHVQFMYTLMRHLPDKYYSNLMKFFIVSPSFVLKSYNFFSTPSKLKNKLEYLKSVKDIYQLDFYRVQFGVKLQNFLKQSELSKEDAEEEKDKIFGVRLEELEISETTLIPRIIEELIGYFKFNEDHLKEQGIFRKVPRVDDVKEMEKHLVLKDYEYIRQHEDPHVVASVLKRFLNQFPEPIFPFKQYDLIKKYIVSISNLEERKMRIKSITLQLSELNYRVLGNIIELLHKVEEFSEFNLMKMEALTRIFSPTLIRCRPYAEKLDEAKEELMMSKIVLDVVQTIYINHEELFENDGTGIINRIKPKGNNQGKGNNECKNNENEEDNTNNSKRSAIFQKILDSVCEDDEDQGGNNQIDFRELYRQQYEAERNPEVDQTNVKGEINAKKPTIMDNIQDNYYVLKDSNPTKNDGVIQKNNNTNNNSENIQQKQDKDFSSNAREEQLQESRALFSHQNNIYQHNELADESSNREKQAFPNDPNTKKIPRRAFHFQENFQHQ